jgi:hypothetical protein
MSYSKLPVVLFLAENNRPSNLNHIKPILLKGQSHEKVGELRVWGISLGPS